MIAKVASEESELKQILDLQHANHFELVSAETKKNEGFVTVKHSFDLLKQMNDASPQIIAISNNQVVGYALVMLQDFKDLIPVLIPMFITFNNLSFNGQPLSEFNYYVMGQVCIAKEYRGQGIFEALYQKHKEVYSQNFDLCLTEVSTSNIRSMKAHFKVGFKTLHTYKDETDEWNIIFWDWK